MEQNEDLLYIKGTQNKKLYYYFTPAAIASQFVPLIIILGNAEKSARLNFEYKMWNVLTPVLEDTTEDKELLQELISQVIEDNECEDHIYVYGNSDEAILHGILCKANAVYAPCPKDSTLNKLLNSTDTFPIFFLSDKDSLVGKDNSFIDTCNRHKIKINSDICIKEKDNEVDYIKEVLNMLERMSSQE